MEFEIKDKAGNYYVPVGLHAFTAQADGSYEVAGKLLEMKKGDTLYFVDNRPGEVFESLAEAEAARNE